MQGQRGDRKRGVRGAKGRKPRRLTLEVVKALATPERGEYVQWDTEQPAFGVRVRAGCRMQYVVRLWTGGRQRWVSIGAHGDVAPDGRPWTPDTARAKALEHLGIQASGRDPAAARDLGKLTPTLAEFAPRYLTDYAEAHKKPRTVIEERSLLGLRVPRQKPRAGQAEAPKKKPRTILAALGPLKLDAVTTAHVARFHLAWKDTPTRANRALSLLSHMFTMGERWGLRPNGSNPCRHVDRFKESKRERFLSAAELALVGAAIAKLKKAGAVTPFGLAAVQLLIFTGARAGEVLGLKWDEVDIEAGTARLPDSKTGAKTVMLPAPARKLLKELPRIEGNPHVIVGGRTGQPLTLWGIEQVWQEVRRGADLEDVRLHDLRHSFASVAAASGQSLPVIGALLGHTTAETTKRYAHLSADPLKAASDAVAERLAAAMKAKPASQAKKRKRSA